MRRVGNDERRVRLAARHHLVAPVSGVDSVASDLVGLHSSDPATVYLSARARIDGFAPDDLEEALYERRSLVRMLGMRRTMFVVPTDLAAVMDTACTRSLVAAERRRTIKLIEEQGLTDVGSVWLADVSQRTLAALADRGEATATELTDSVPELGLKIAFGQGKKWAGTVGVSTRILFLLATEGKIVRVRPRGSWLSSQYRWAPTDYWIDGGLERWDRADAAADLGARWLRTFGPGTRDDLRWWTGWTVRQTTEALDRVGAVEVELEDGTGYVMPDDTAVEPSIGGPWVALLPGLDSTVMGWKERGWYLGDHADRLFDRNGNAGPTVWVDGRVVGGWAQRRSGEVVHGLLEPVGSEAEDMVHHEADRLREWLGELRLTPRFRTPLEKELTADS